MKTSTAVMVTTIAGLAIFGATIVGLVLVGAPDLAGWIVFALFIFVFWMAS
jgi:hypothetical protein